MTLKFINKIISKQRLLLQMKEINQKLSFSYITFSKPQPTNTSITRCLANVQNKYTFTFQDVSHWFYSQTVPRLVKHSLIKLSVYKCKEIPQETSFLIYRI